MNKSPDGFLRAADVRARYGGVSDMWIWRRINASESNFPKPTYFGRNRFWKLSELEDWERRCAFPSTSAS